MRARALAAVAVVAGLAAVAMAGAAPFGRLLMAAGVPGMAAPFLSDPAWHGAARYRAGDWDAAAEAFRAAGSDYNLGLAQARAQDYAAALEAFDLARLTGDGDARANFDLVTAYYAGLRLDPGTIVSWATEREAVGPTEEAPIGRGSGRAAGTGTESTNAGALLGLPELESRGITGVRGVFDDRFMVADDRWLAQLEDVPGAYLDERIRFEAKRRADAGLTPPDPEDPR